MRAADVFVLPSLGENMPCALLEALACGVPAVASRVGGVPRFSTRARGVLVEPGSAEALAAGIEPWRPDSTDTTAPRRRRRRGSRYGNDAIGRRWSSVYALAVGEHGP